MICDEGGEGYACDGYACDSVEFIRSQSGFYEVYVEVADSFERVGEAGDYSEVDVVGACSAAGELEGSKL